MKAVVKDKPQPGIVVKEVPNPVLGAEDVLLQVKRSSICGSDLGLYDFTPAYAGFAKLPLIPGHEFAGEIVDVGSDVTEYVKGERVVAESVIGCGGCKFCREGQTNLCVNFSIMGVHRNGGFSEFVVVPSRHLHHLRDEIGFPEAALLEPLSVVCHAIFDICRIEPADFVTVLGPGPIGLLAAEVARASGSSRILISGIEIDKERLELARKLGFKTISSSETDPVKETLGATDGLGADVAIVAAGSNQALANACDMVRKGGKVLTIGIFSKPVELHMTNLVRRQISLFGTFASSWKNYEEAMSLVEYGKVNLNPLVTHHFKIDDATLAFEVAKSKEGCKVQISM
jgi:L-iditol 2-dehydrogenase